MHPLASPLGPLRPASQQAPPHFASHDSPVPCASLDNLYLVFSSEPWPSAGAVVNSVV